MLKVAAKKNPMTDLYDRLGSVGLPRKYLQEIVLPNWWDDEIAHNSAGYAEGLMILSKNLGLDLSTMQNQAVPVGLRNLGPCKFKKVARTRDEDLLLARTVATRVVDLIGPAVPKVKIHLPTTATEIRQVILRSGLPWVDLLSLVNYCWSVAVPVLPVSVFPPRAKKMDGLTSLRSDRYAVVISKNAKHSAWLLFVLAHELGHIFQGHLRNEGVLVDELVDRKSTDEEEKTANNFALELLTGNPELEVFPVGRKASARALARAALQAGEKEQIDPGHIVLNCAFQMGGDFFAIANAALRLLEPHADAVASLRSTMLANLDKTELPEDTYEFILKACRARPVQ